MHVSDSINDRFFRGVRSGAVPFVVNDSVRVVSGPHAGRTGAVVSIVSISPNPVFVVEPGATPFDDLEIPQSNLELIPPISE